MLVPKQLLGAAPHHLAKSRVDVGQATVQVERAQTGQERIFHGLPKGQRLGQLAFGALAPAQVAQQQRQQAEQPQRQRPHRQRQRGDGGVFGAAALFDQQHPRGARQSHQLAGAVQGLPRLGQLADHDEAGAIGFGPRQAPPALGLGRDELGQQPRHGVSGHQVAVGAAVAL